MKNHIYFSILILYVFFFQDNILEAQTYNFYLGGGVPLFFSNEYTEIKEPSLLRVIPNSDSLFLRVPTIVEEIRINDFNPLASLEAGFKIGWKLNDKISIESGIGVFTLKFKGKSKSIRSFVRSTGVPDTVVLESFNGFQTLDCDYFTHDIFPILQGEQGRRIEYSFFGLSIPISLVYEMVPDMLQIGAGASLRAPIFSSREKGFMMTDFETDGNGLTVCTHRTVKEKDVSGGDFNNLVITADFELTGWFRRFGVSLAVSNWTASIFSKNNGLNSFVFNDQKTIPRLYTLRVKYQIGNKE